MWLAETVLAWSCLITLFCLFITDSDVDSFYFHCTMHILYKHLKSSCFCEKANGCWKPLTARNSLTNIMRFTKELDTQRLSVSGDQDCCFCFVCRIVLKVCKTLWKCSHLNWIVILLLTLILSLQILLLQCNVLILWVI